MECVELDTENRDGILVAVMEVPMDAQIGNLGRGFIEALVQAGFSEGWEIYLDMEERRAYYWNEDAEHEDEGDWFDVSVSGKEWESMEKANSGESGMFRFPVPMRCLVKDFPE